MLDLSPEKLLLLGIIAFVVLGPQRLPQVARTAGRWVADLRRMSANVQTEMRDALAEPREALSGAVADMGLEGVKLADLRPGRVRRAIAGSVTGAILGPESSSSGASAPVGPAVDPTAAPGTSPAEFAPRRPGGDGVPMDALEQGAGVGFDGPPERPERTSSSMPPPGAIPDDPSLN